MIVFEERIAELISTLPKINGFKINFEWVKDVEDVNKYIVLQDRPYPVIFLLTSKETSEVVTSGTYNETSRPCTFILATRELDTSKTNTQRGRSSYKNVLNPLAESFLNELKYSSISRIESFGLERVPNYGKKSTADSKSNKSGQIDLWDTIIITADVTINNQCLR